MTVRPISLVLEDIRSQFNADTMTVDDVLSAFHERGFGFILLIFALPMALPIPVPPGVNVIMAAPLILLTAQQAIGRHTIWLPQRTRRKSIETSSFHKMIAGCIPWLRRLEYVIRPRLGFMTQGLFSNLIGIFGLLMALAILVPIPLTNSVPSLGIAIMAIGVIMRDGLAVLAGATIGLLWIALLTAALLFFGTEGIDLLKETVKSLWV